MVNSGVFSSKREIRTICAAWKEKEKRDHQFLFFEKSMHSLGSDPYSYDVCFIQKEDSPTREIFEMFFVIYRNEY